jgi:hypothetical protein
MAFTKKTTCETKEISCMSQSSLFKQERRGDSQRVIANRLAHQQALCNRIKRQESSHSYCLVWIGYSTTVQTRIQCNDNSTRSYENQSVHRAVSKLVKTTINTAIAVKLLKSKVTLNTCEKLKMTQRDTGNIKSKVNETC